MWLNTRVATGTKQMSRHAATPDTKAAHTMMVAATMKAPVHATTERAGERRLRRRDACSTAQVEEKAASEAPMHPMSTMNQASSIKGTPAPLTSPPSSMPSEMAPGRENASGAAMSEDPTSSTPPITPMAACTAP